MEMLSQPDVKRQTELETYAAESVDVWIQYGCGSYVGGSRGTSAVTRPLRPFYSSRSAVTTGRRAARQAGNSPPSRPIATE